MNLLKNCAFLFCSIFLLSCISGTPDCDDYDAYELKSRLIRHELGEVYDEYFEVLKEVRNHWIGQGYVEYSISDPNATSEMNPNFDKKKNDHLGDLWEGSSKKLEDLWKTETERLQEELSQVVLADEISLMYESENTSLTQFNCTCYMKYTLGESAHDLTYKLTRKDWDSQTYHEVLGSSFRSNRLSSDSVWNYIIFGENGSE